MQSTPLHELPESALLRLTRRGVLNGEPIPPATEAVLTAWGHNVPELQRRWIDTQRFRQ